MYVCGVISLYIHIPFCKSRCSYCSFFSTTQAEEKERYVSALCKEISRESMGLKDRSLQTIYLGGGTPSQLTSRELERLFEAIYANFNTSQLEEVTVECNPDDLTAEYTAMLSRLPVNRISMGIQTFDNRLLLRLGRRHNAGQAIRAVGNCRESGFKNISMDLMYGLPGQTVEIQTADLAKALTLDVEHISAYHLSYESGTPFQKMLEKGLVEETDESVSANMYENLCTRLKEAGYRHYEISNFSKEGFRSRHNSNYWTGAPYLGLGAGAHSYDGAGVRRWNCSDLKRYMKAQESGISCYESEFLTGEDLHNEHIMLSLRCCEGISLTLFNKKFGEKLTGRLVRLAGRYVSSGELIHKEGCIRFTEHSLFISDHIISDLFL